MDTNPELKKTLKETFDSYLHEGLVLKLDSLLQDRPSMTLAELKQNSMLMVEGSRFNKRAIARVTSQRGKFVPTRMIALLVANENYSELRRLRDFKGFKNLNKLRYDRAKLKQGLKCLGFKDEDIRVLDDPSMKVFTDTMNTIRSDCTKHYK